MSSFPWKWNARPVVFSWRLWEVNVAVNVKGKEHCNLLLVCPFHDPFIGDKSNEQGPEQGMGMA